MLLCYLYILIIINITVTIHNYDVIFLYFEETQKTSFELKPPFKVYVCNKKILLWDIKGKYIYIHMNKLS